MSQQKESIWSYQDTIENINSRGENTLFRTLGIRFTEIGPDYMVAEMPVTPAVHQPMGLLHGGASVALAETVGSVAANHMLDIEKFFAVGQEINANHIRSITKGVVKAKATPAHVGRQSHVWEINITDENDKLICISRLTMAVVPRPAKVKN